MPFVIPLRLHSRRRGRGLRPLSSRAIARHCCCGPRLGKVHRAPPQPAITRCRPRFGRWSVCSCAPPEKKWALAFGVPCAMCVPTLTMARPRPTWAQQYLIVSVSGLSPRWGGYPLADSGMARSVAVAMGMQQRHSALMRVSCLRLPTGRCERRPKESERGTQLTSGQTFSLNGLTRHGVWFAFVVLCVCVSSAHGCCGIPLACVCMLMCVVAFWPKIRLFPCVYSCVPDLCPVQAPHGQGYNEL